MVPDTNTPTNAFLEAILITAERISCLKVLFHKSLEFLS